jgi:hypothetical protein
VGEERVHLIPDLGRIKLAKLTPMRIQRFIRDELQADKGPATVKQSLTTLWMALKHAVAWGLLARNAAALVEGIASKPAERRPFTVDEQVAILRAARSDPLYGNGRTRPSDRNAPIRTARAVLVRRRPGKRLAGPAQAARPRRQSQDLKTEAAQRSIPLAAAVIQVLRVHKAA